MERDCNIWAEIKHKLQLHQPPLFTQGQIWWCSLGLNVGDEQNGKGDNFVRPIIVMRKFNRNLFVGLPLSSKVKEHHLRHNFSFKVKEQSALFSQVRTLDAKRLRDMMGKLPQHDMQQIKEKLKHSMFST